MVFTAMISAFAVLFLGLFHSSYLRYKGWKSVKATCLDREVQAFYEPEHQKKYWHYRILCEFEFQGCTYKVTPYPSHLMQFNSEKNLNAYLEKHTASSGECVLWFNPKNPVECVFLKKPKLAP